MTNIYQQVIKSRENFTNELCSSIETNKNYNELNRKFYAILNSLANRELANEIEDIQSTIEAEIKEICYSIGFAHAVRIMTACYSETVQNNNFSPELPK
jgi:glutathionyl-hydroquinone reductase